MPRFILTGRRRNPNAMNWSDLYIAGATIYISRKGCTTYDGSNAAVLKSKNEATKELEYWTITQPQTSWTIEELPARMSVGKAVLYSNPI